jgi:hypothetical protein
MHRRTILALAAGLLGALLFTAFVTRVSALAHDFTYPWLGARLLLAGRDPYAPAVLVDPRPADWLPDPLYYPLPAVLLALPLAPLPATLAGALWAGGGAAALAWALQAPGRRHLWPLLLSAPLIVVIAGGNWSAWLTAAALTPALGWLLACKPTLGLALWLAFPSRRAACYAVAAVAVSLAVWPAWPLGWLHNARLAHHPMPAALAPVLLLAALRWRDPRARLVLALALTPQLLLWYDQLPLLLVARTRREALGLAVASWAGVAAWRLGWLGAEWATLLSTFLPALALVLLDRRAQEVDGRRPRAAPGGAQAVADLRDGEAR